MTMNVIRQFRKIALNHLARFKTCSVGLSQACNRSTINGLRFSLRIVGAKAPGLASSSSPQERARYGFRFLEPLIACPAVDFCACPFSADITIRRHPPPNAVHPSRNPPSESSHFDLARRRGRRRTGYHRHPPRRVAVLSFPFLAKRMFSDPSGMNRKSIALTASGQEQRFAVSPNYRNPPIPRSIAHTWTHWSVVVLGSLVPPSTQSVGERSGGQCPLTIAVLVEMTFCYQGRSRRPCPTIFATRSCGFDVPKTDRNTNQALRDLLFPTGQTGTSARDPPIRLRLLQKGQFQPTGARR